MAVTDSFAGNEPRSEARLSICVATFCRAGFIGETLESITSQLRPGVEVVIVDGASPDNTEEVVAEYVARFPSVRYFREERNSGVDADYDKAVGYARGEHCWLATDDDLLASGAVDRVLEMLDGDPLDLLVVDAEIRDLTLARTLKSHRLRFEGERSYGAADADVFLRDTGEALSFIGGTIVRRSVWMKRDRERYFGSLFVHVGAIFQSPAIGRIRVVAEPLVILRAGNGMWRPQSFVIWAFKWPELIWGFAGYGTEAKRAVTPREPWRSLTILMSFRALGAFSFAEYRSHFSVRKIGIARLPLLFAALFPGGLANVLNVIYLIFAERGATAGLYELITSSRFANPISRFLAEPRIGRKPVAERGLP